VLQRFTAHTLIEAELETGRTHQIRVHLSYSGHPLVGDSRYGSRGRLPQHPSKHLVEVIQHFKRQALHACALEFSHPVTGSQVSCSSERPVDLEQLVEALEQDVLERSQT